MTMESNVIKFPFAVSRRAHARKPRASKNGTPEERISLRETDVEEIRKMVVEEIGARRAAAQPAAGSLSTTGENGRLRLERREAWWDSERVTRYWRLRIDFEDAVSSVQKIGAPEGRLHPAVKPEDHMPLVERYRAAKAKQLLTPAPDAAAIKWKQAALAEESKYNFVGVKPERIERAIADDLAFLAAHPVRQSNRQRQG
jgi:hypothetical protein